jgi:hypothetical protein
LAVTLAVIAAKTGEKWRGWMRIELTRDASQRPANGFEDRGRHQPPYIPSAATLTTRAA